jgi:branched-chain amino acid transport system ATP-binding protein
VSSGSDSIDPKKALKSEVALELSSLKVAYGGIAAVKGVSLTVERGEIVTLIGANGAGKSSVLKSIVQLVPHASGTVRVLGKDVRALPTHRVVELGVALVPEGRAIFGNLSVRENLLLGAFLKRDTLSIEKNLARSVALFPRLGERMDQNAGTLSGGEQQMLAIGRGLMTNPDCLIMDEPSEGLAPIIIQGLWEAIAKLKQEGLSILLVEQNAALALKLVDFVHVISKGRVVYSGLPNALWEDHDVKSRFLGI